MTTTPSLAAFLMLRRQSWFIPASTSASVRPGERDLEDVLRLAGREAALGGLRAPAELVQLGDHPGAGVVALGRRQVAEPAHGVVGDALP